MSARRRAAIVRRYLRTGHHDHQALDWGGLSLQPRVIAKDDLRDALLDAVRQRAAAVSIPSVSVPGDVYGFARAKVEPMVRGLFPAGEQATVLDVLARSVVFVTPESVEDLLRRQGWPHTAWALANLYLDSIGAELLGPRAPSTPASSCGPTAAVRACRSRGDTKPATPTTGTLTPVASRPTTPSRNSGPTESSTT